MDIEKIAQAIEADAGMTLDDIRQGLAEMQAGSGRVTTAVRWQLCAIGNKAVLRRLAVCCAC